MANRLKGQFGLGNPRPDTRPLGMSMRPTTGILVLAVILALPLSSCDFQYREDFTEGDLHLLTHTWQLAEVQKLSGDIRTANNPLSAAVRTGILKTGLSISLFPDGSFSELIGYDYSHGRWNLDDDNHIALAWDNRRDSVRLLEYYHDGNDAYLVAAYRNHGIFQFVRDGHRLSDFRDDPFHPSNNMWRLKPDSTESQAQLMTRVREFIRHTALIHQAADELGAEAVSFRHSLMIMRIYAGGIGVIREKSIPDQWVQCFFSPEQANTAYHIFSRWLADLQYRGAASDDWVRDNISILQAMLQHADDALARVDATS